MSLLTALRSSSVRRVCGWQGFKPLRNQDVFRPLDLVDLVILVFFSQIVLCFVQEEESL